MPDRAPIKPIPDAYPRVSATLCVDRAHEAIKLYQALFGAEVQLLVRTKSDKVRHAQLRIGDSLVLLSDEFPELDMQGPRAFGGTPVSLLVFVADVDDVFERAIKAGCRSIWSVRDQFYGDRSGKFEDPFGHRWSVASHIEDLSLQEIEKRALALERQ